MRSFLRFSRPAFAALLLFSASPAFSSADVVSAPAAAVPSAVAPYQRELLQLAFDTASAVPHKPHVKTRAKLQYDVVSQWIALGELKTAADLARSIDDWQQGLAWADLAYGHQQDGDATRAAQYAERAIFVASKSEDWRRDRIRVCLSEYYALLGDNARVKIMLDGLDSSEQAKALSSFAVSPSTLYKAQLGELDAFIATGHTDVTRNAIERLAQLQDEHFNVTAQRQEIDARIEGNIGKLPVFQQLQILGTLAGNAARHGDQAGALAMVDRMQALIDGHNWPLEDRIKLSALVVKTRGETIDHESAKAQATAVLEQFRREGGTIKNFWRGEALRPLAEAFAGLGDKESAMVTFKIAAKEGGENENARPRAEDLTALCLSLSKAGIEPDAALWASLRTLREGLLDPW